MIVADSSALVDYLAGGDAYAWVERQLASASSVHAPHLVDVEFVGALRRLEARGAVSAAVAEDAVAALGEIGLRRHGHLPYVERMWSLRANLTAADAAFVALAEALEVPLVTLDGRLARAPGLPVVVLAPG